METVSRKNKIKKYYFFGRNICWDKKREFHNVNLAKFGNVILKLENKELHVAFTIHKFVKNKTEFYF